MAKRGDVIEIQDFGGGLVTYDSEYSMDLTSSPDCQNIVLLERGFMKRQGDVAWNSSAMVSASTPVVGLGYMKLNSGAEFLTAIAGTKFFTDTSMNGTMTDVTGAVTITSGQNNLWTPVTYNNLQIWFGGAPDAPFTYSGSGNAAALGGTPPSAATAFVANNRVFAISTAANPSRVQWPILGNPADWTGSGSGSSDVVTSDGEALQCGVVVGTDTAILFKNTSSHLMVLTRQPFPIYQLQKGVGVAGRNAYCLVNGVVYIVTPGKRMKATSDGTNFVDFPDSINDIWDSIPATRVPYIQGIYYENLRQVHWYVSTGSSQTSNNTRIVWDLLRKCWLRDPSGFKSNVVGLVQGRRLFAGHYNGKLYEKDKLDTFTDASETTPFAIDSYWRTPFKGLPGLASTIHPMWIDFCCLAETNTNMEISYGFDFSPNASTQSLSIVPAGAQWDVDEWDVGFWGGQIAVIKRAFVSGRGNVFSVKFRNAEASQGFTFQGASLQVRTDKSRKLLNVV